MHSHALPKADPQGKQNLQQKKFAASFVFSSPCVENFVHRPVEFSIDKERAGIARILKFVSIAEKISVVVAWELLRSLDLVVNAAMATDIMNPDVVLWHKKTWEKLFNPSLSSDAFLLDIDINCIAAIVIERIIQALHVDFAFQPSSAAVGGGSNMVGVKNDLK
jgi:hypothetical protein